MVQHQYAMHSLQKETCDHKQDLQDNLDLVEKMDLVRWIMVENACHPAAHWHVKQL